MIKFQVLYYNDGGYSHEYTENWDKAEWFCPACGRREVYEEQGGGDYYVGTRFLCEKCGAKFYLPDPPEPCPKNDQHQQRLAAIRSACKGEPK